MEPSRQIQIVFEILNSYRLICLTERLAKTRLKSM